MTFVICNPLDKNRVAVVVSRLIRIEHGQSERREISLRGFALTAGVVFEKPPAGLDAYENTYKTGMIGVSDQSST